MQFNPYALSTFGTFNVTFLEHAWLQVPAAPGWAQFHHKCKCWGPLHPHKHACVFPFSFNSQISMRFSHVREILQGCSLADDTGLNGHWTLVLVGEANLQDYGAGSKNNDARRMLLARMCLCVRVQRSQVRSHLNFHKCLTEQTTGLADTVPWLSWRAQVCKWHTHSHCRDLSAHKQKHLP